MYIFMYIFMYIQVYGKYKYLLLHVISSFSASQHLYRLLIWSSNTYAVKYDSWDSPAAVESQMVSYLQDQIFAWVIS